MRPRCRNWNRQWFLFTSKTIDRPVRMSASAVNTQNNRTGTRHADVKTSQTPCTPSARARWTHDICEAETPEEESRESSRFMFHGGVRCVCVWRRQFGDALRHYKDWRHDSAQLTYGWIVSSFRGGVRAQLLLVPEWNIALKCLLDDSKKSFFLGTKSAGFPSVGGWNWTAVMISRQRRIRKLLYLALKLIASFNSSLLHLQWILF